MVSRGSRSCAFSGAIIGRGPALLAGDDGGASLVCKPDYLLLLVPGPTLPWLEGFAEVDPLVDFMLAPVVFMLVPVVME